ncbi:MAG: glycosyltransferase [Promethearchaeota archaeon]
MNLINWTLELIRIILNFISSIGFILIIIFIIIIIYTLLYFLRDRKNIKIYLNFKDPDFLPLNALNILPLVNIIIPAWKEGTIFKNLLVSIKNLTYPAIKVIVNAGGNDETIEIANSFKKYDNFIILYQKRGADRPSLGKIRALNECLQFISEGIVYFIDADSYLSDEILLRMIYPITNLDENIVLGGVRPLKNQESKDLVKYLLFDRFYSPKTKFSRHVSNPPITGQSLCLKYEVIKSIGRFTENKNYATDKSMGIDIYSKGFNSYLLYDYRHRIYVDYSSTISELIHQKTIWIENALFFSFKNKKLNIVKFLFSFLISLYIISFPFLLFIHSAFFLIGVLMLLIIYFLKIKKLLFFKRVVNKEFYEKYGIIFFLKLIFYIFIEVIIILRIPFHFLVFLIKSKK